MTKPCSKTCGSAASPCSVVDEAATADDVAMRATAVKWRLVFSGILLGHRRVSVVADGMSLVRPVVNSLVMSYA